MKKVLLIALVLLMVSVCCIAVACGENPAQPNGSNDVNITQPDDTTGDPAPAHVHTYGDWAVTTPATCTAEGVETRTCSCGERETRPIAKTHTYGEWATTREPSCDRTGSKEHTCSVCGDVQTETIAKVPHTPVIDEAVPATCIATGKTAGSHCEVCGATLERQTTVPIDSAAHSYGNWIESTPATCTVDGLQYRVCGLCNNIERQTIYAAGHQGEWTTTKEATCTVAGRRERDCTVCGQHITEAIAANGHAYGAWAVTVAPTCGLGKEARTCSVCGNTETRALPADLSRQHQYGEDGVCSVCGEHRATAGLQFSISGNTAAVTGYTGTDTEVYIPAMYAGAMVTSVGFKAFNNCSLLTSISIPNSVTSIGNYAFNNCSALTSISIPEGVTSIGSRAFYGCSGLTSITIPTSVNRIGLAFYDCTKLAEIHYKGNLASWCAIEGLDNLMSNGTNKALYINDVLISGELVLPDGVISIGGYAFYGCSGLTSVTIPEGVTYIWDHAFRGCSGLTSVTIPEGVTYIGNSAFSDCSGLTSVTIPEGVTYIGDSAFFRCSGLTSIIIPDGITTIGRYAFRGCSGLTSITVSASATSIGAEAFNGCSELTDIYYDGSQTQWNAISKGYNWNSNTGNYTIHCTDGVIAKE